MENDEIMRLQKSLDQLDESIDSIKDAFKSLGVHLQKSMEVGTTAITNLQNAFIELANHSDKIKRLEKNFDELNGTLDGLKAVFSNMSVQIQESVEANKTAVNDLQNAFAVLGDSGKNAADGIAGCSYGNILPMDVLHSYIMTLRVL